MNNSKISKKTRNIPNNQNEWKLFLLAYDRFGVFIDFHYKLIENLDYNFFDMIYHICSYEDFVSNSLRIELKKITNIFHEMMCRMNKIFNNVKSIFTDRIPNIITMFCLEEKNKERLKNNIIFILNSIFKENNIDFESYLIFVNTIIENIVSLIMDTQNKLKDIYVFSSKIYEFIENKKNYKILLSFASKFSKYETSLDTYDGFVRTYRSNKNFLNDIKNVAPLYHKICKKEEKYVSKLNHINIKNETIIRPVKNSIVPLTYEMNGMENYDKVYNKPLRIKERLMIYYK